jgi:uncharacterized membrane protein YagU involved in acid resistance
MAHAAEPPRVVIVSNQLIAAVMGGLAGGIAFGLLMQVTDIMLLVAALVDSSRATVGWAVHLSISLLFGSVFALAASFRVRTVGVAVVAGVLYGWFWWILGGLIIMPAWLGRDDLIFRFTATAWQSLAGHIIYGLQLGLVYGVVRRRVERPVRERPMAAPWKDAARTDPAARRRRSSAAVLASSRGIAAARHSRRQ